MVCADVGIEIVRRQLSELVIIHHVYFTGQNQVVSVGLIASAWIVSEKRNY